MAAEITPAPSRRSFPISSNYAPGGILDRSRILGRRGKHNPRGVNPQERIEPTVSLWPQPGPEGPEHPGSSRTVDPPRLAERLHIARLRRIDGQVRAHEQAHLAALGAYALGAPHYTYAIGPDGQLYAVGGSIAVDLKPIPGNPEATIRKARMLRRAAYGPMRPSAQDLRIAAAAYRLEVEAHRELARQEAEEAPLNGAAAAEDTAAEDAATDSSAAGWAAPEGGVEMGRYLDILV